MKKLIAMIGAVATAFGLFADATPFATSFEAADGVTEATYTPGDGWTWQGDPLTVGVYAGDKYTYGDGALARRNGSFMDNANDNYLKLETGTNALTRAVGGNVFLDQLVKFTGFEEYQTNVVAGTKIAVWMSGIEQEGTATWVPEVPAKEAETNELGEIISPATEAIPAHYDYSEDYIASETNLYVTVGKIDGDGDVTPIKIKIDGSYKLDTWYRLTIKSLGSIFQYSDHAGFIIYVDGQQVKGADAEAKSLIVNTDDMTPTAKGYMADGALFPAIDTTDATFATVGYQGIGAIDDIILDEEGPAFAQAIDVIIEFLKPGVEGDPTIEVDYIDVGGVHMGYPLAVPAGTEIIVRFKPVAGKKFMSQLDPITLTVTANNYTIDVSDVVAEDVVAKKNDTIDLAASEMAEALAALVENDEVVFVADCMVKENPQDEAYIYSFTQGTTIDVGANVWEIFVANIDEETAGNLEVNADIATGFTMDVEVEGADLGGMFMFTGDVAGTLLANTIELAMNDEIEVSGTVKADAFVSIDNYVTLTGAGKVITQTDPDEISGMIIDGESTEVAPTENDPEEGWYTYALATEPETTGFAIIIAEQDPVYYPTLREAIEAYDGEGAVTIMEDATLTETIEIDKSVVIDLNGKTLTFAADLTTGIIAQDVEGAVTISNGKIASAAGRENIAGSKAIYFLRTSAVLTNVEIDVPGFDYALTHMGNIGDLDRDRDEYWTVDTPYTLDCNNVDVKGNGSLFHLEYVKADLDADCSAIQYTDKGYFSAAHQAAIYSSCGAEVTVNGGTYTAVNALQTGNLGGDIYVMGGEFNGNIKSFMLDEDDRYDSNIANIDIYGGTFKDGNIVYDTGCSKDCFSLEWDITAGAFAFDPSDYLETGYVATFDENTGLYSVAQSVAVAKIGDKDYPTLAAAVAAVDDGQTIQLLDDVALATEGLTFSKSCIFDLGGYTLTCPTESINTKQFVIGAGAEVVFTNGTVAAAGATGGRGIQIQGKLINWADWNWAAEGVPNTTGLFDLGLSGTMGEVVVNGGNIVSAGDIFRAKISAAPAKVTINGGTLTATGEYGMFYTQEGTSMQAAINGGVIEGTLSSLYLDQVTMTLNAEGSAKFSNVDNLDTFLPTGYEFVKGEDSYYTIQKIVPPVAKIGTTEFKTLQAAFDAAQAGVTVELLDNLTIEETVNFKNKDFTFNLGGFTLTGATGISKMITFEDSSLVLTNGTLKGDNCYIIENTKSETSNSHITIAVDATIDGNYAYVFYPRSATIDIYGKIINRSQEWQCCVWLTTEGEVVNVYDSAILTSATGDIFRHWCNTAEVSANAAVLNVYGGTFNGAQIVNGYASAGSVNSGSVNIYGGEFTMSANELIKKAPDMTVRQLGGDCVAMFSKVGNLADYCAPGYAPVKDGNWYVIAKLYNVTIAPTENGTVETSVTNNIVAGTEVTITATPATDYAVDTIAVTNGDAEVTVENNKFLMPAGNVTVYVTFKSTGPDIPVNPDVELTDAGKAAAAEVAEVFGDDLATWVAKVYGDGGKIPASKLNATTSDLIAIAQAYDLPIMTEPEVEIEKAAEGDGFTFQIVDDGTPVAMQAAKVLSMVQFTADLGVAFDAATTDNVTVDLSADKKTATATFKKATNAGFMKVKLATPAK